MSTAPIPGSWIKPKEKTEKKPFVLSEHLNTKPLRRNSELMALRKQLTKKGKNK